MSKQEDDLNDCIGASEALSASDVWRQFEGDADIVFSLMFKEAMDKVKPKMQDFILNNSDLPMHGCTPLCEINGTGSVTYPGVDALISERGSRYGKFKDGADIMQSLKDVMHEVDGWNNLSPSQKEALDMIQHKIGRILNGDPNYDDNWKDVAGYATLIVNELSGEVK